MYCFLVLGVFLMEVGGFVFEELLVFLGRFIWFFLGRNLRRSKRRKGEELEIFYLRFFIV